MAERQNRHQRNTNALHRSDNFAENLRHFSEALMLPKQNARGDSHTSLGTTPCTPEAVDAALDCLIDRLLPTISASLKAMEHVNLGVEQNRQLVRCLNRLLARLDCSLLCPHCKTPAPGLRYANSGTAKTPVFKYRHRDNAHGATVAVGPLTLVRGRG